MMARWLKIISNPIFRYIFAILTVVIATLLSHWLWPLVKTGPLLLYMAAVALSAWLGGFVPGLIATVLSVMAVDYYLIEPLYRVFSNHSDVVQIIIFALVALLISGLNEARRKSSDELRTSRDQLRIILGGVGDGIMVLNAYGQPVYANEAAASLLGLQSAEELVELTGMQLGRHFTAYDEEDNSIPEADLPGRIALHKGKRSDRTVQVRLAESGKTVWLAMHAQPVFDAKGRVTMAVNIMRDVTRRQIEVGKLREERERFMVTLNSIGDAVIATDVDGKIEFMNPVAAHLTGQSERHAVGQHYADVINIVDQQNHDKVVNPLEAALKDGKSVNFAAHTLLLTGNQAEKPVEAVGAPLMVDGDTITGAVLVLRDISERRRSELEMAALTHTIELQRQRLNNIVANVPGVVWEAYGEPDAASQRIDFVSDYTENMLGYSRKDWLGTPNFWLSIVHPDDKARAASKARMTYDFRQIQH